MAKPKITIVHYTCTPITGGVEVVMEAHARLFANNGYEVTVLVARGESFDDRVRVLNVPEIDSTHPINAQIAEALDRSGALPSTYEAYKDQLKQVMSQHLAGQDVVIMHNILAKDLNFPLIHALKEIIAEQDGSRRFVSWIHDPSAMAFDAPDWLKTTDKMPWSLINTPIPGVEHVTLSRERRRELCELYDVSPDQITVIPDGVDMEGLLGLNPLSVRIWDDFDLPNQDIVLFTPSRIVHKKNIELGIQVTHEITQLGRKAKLIVTGPPSVHLPTDGDKAYYEKIKKLVRQLDMEENIIFLFEYKDEAGNPVRIIPPVMRDLYLLTDMLFLGSLEEGFGMPLLEAGLLKTQVVCSSIKPFKEIGEGDVLYLEPGDSPREYAMKIVNTVERSLRRNLFKKVLRHYSWDSIFRKRIEPYILHGPLPAKST